MIMFKDVDSKALQFWQRYIFQDVNECKFVNMIILNQYINYHINKYVNIIIDKYPVTKTIIDRYHVHTNKI